MRISFLIVKRIILIKITFDCKYEFTMKTMLELQPNWKWPANLLADVKIAEWIDSTIVSKKKQLVQWFYSGRISLLDHENIQPVQTGS